MLLHISKYSSIRRFKNWFKDYYFYHQSQSLTAAIIPIVIIAIIIFSNPFSLRNYLLNLKTAIRVLCCLHKVFTICYIYEPFCRQNVWRLGGAFSRNVWPRHGVCYFLRSAASRCLRMVLNIPLFRDWSIWFRDYCLQMISLNQGLFLLSLLCHYNFKPLLPEEFSSCSKNSYHTFIGTTISHTTQISVDPPVIRCLIIFGP